MNPRKTFQLFYSPDGAAGAGAGAGAADGKAAGDGNAAAGDGTGAADGKTVDDGKSGDAGKTPEQIAADKKTADDAAAADALKNETPEQKTAREKKATDDAAAAAKSKAPDKYELKVTKDAAAFVDAADLTLIEKVARDKGMTNEQAQTLVDARANALLEQTVAFRAITEADPTYGGDNLKETQRLATVALDKLRPAGTPRGDAFRQILTKTGYGNNLEIVSLLADLGKSLAEDMPGGGSGGAGAKKKDIASVLYDHPTSKTEG